MYSNNHVGFGVLVCSSNTWLGFKIYQINLCFVANYPIAHQNNTLYIRPATSLSFLQKIAVPMHLPVTSGQLMKPGVGENMYCVVGDFALDLSLPFSRGCAWFTSSSCTCCCCSDKDSKLHVCSTYIMHTYYQGGYVSFRSVRVFLQRYLYYYFGYKVP